MGEQKPRFGFRLPWSLSSAPAPRPAVVSRSPTSATITTRSTTKKPNPTSTEAQSSSQPNANPTPAQRTKSRPSGVSPAQPSPSQAQSSPRTNSQSSTQDPTLNPKAKPETKNPDQLPTASSTPIAENKVPSKTTTTSTPIPARTPLRSSSQAAEKNSLQQAQATPENDSQPSPPSRASSRVSSQPLSSSHESSQSRATSDPISPSRELPQSRVNSQPQSPPLVSQPQAAPQPSARDRSKPQKSSQTVRQPRPAVKPSGKTSSTPSDPLTGTNVQPRAGTTNQTPSPPKDINPVELYNPAPSPNNPLSPVSEQNQGMSSLEKAATQPDATAAQPSEQSGTIVDKEMPSPKKKPDNTLDGFYPKLPTSHMETEKWKETTENDTVTYEASDSMEHTKEPPRVAVQPEEMQLEKKYRLSRKEGFKETASGLNGKQTKTMHSHPKDKSMVSDIRQKPTTSNGEQISLQKDIRNDISKLAHKMAIARPEQSMEEKSVSVITLVGENQGAFMHLGSESAKREKTVPIHRGYKINPNESTEATSDGEESSRGRRIKDVYAKEDQKTKAYLNSNCQSVNNSILFNGSITERNPGVHLTLSGNPTETIKSNDDTDTLKAHKAEVAVTPSQKVTYEPTIRRRCLRGLLLEPSDYDSDNPEKPRRHGCRYSCRDKNKDNEIDVD